MTQNYDSSLKIKDALQLYFSKYHFENGGYDLKWFKIKIGPVSLSFPNTKARVAAVKIHDIHHVLTEYEATLPGEAEIGAWEIASGCGRYHVAWLLNLASFFYGMLLFPTRVLKAFLSGKNCATNFYYNTVYDDVLLNKTVGALREVIEIDQKKNNRVTDYLLFLLYFMSLLAVATVFLYMLLRLVWIR